MAKLHYYIIFLFLITSSSCTSKSERSLRAREKVAQHEVEKHPFIQQENYYVSKVIDGDTFWVQNSRADKFKIRLIGIDAPETRNVFYKKKQPYGKESKEYLTNLIDKQYLRLEFDVDSLDQYGRTLAYAYLENNEMVNELLLKTGNAQILTITPNIKFEEKFIMAQRFAREQALGLWGLELSE